MIQSLVTLKLLPGLNHPATKATSGRGWPTRNIVDRGGGGIGTRRRCANVREAKATSSSLPTPPDRDRDRDRDGEEEGEEGASSAAALFLFRSQTYALLKQQMAVAAKFEDYKEAARIRDSLKFFEEEEPALHLRKLMRKAIEEERFEDYKEAARIRDSLKFFEEEEPALHLRKLMRKAIEEERFEDAAKYRDELKIIAPHSLLKCSSDATTLGIRVQVRSVYIESRSHPSKWQYFFAYRIRISNNSQHPVQLLRRHWIITDANGRTENVWGAGVIGEQPVIHPRTGFEYSSACPLSTPSGRMEGDFEMKRIDKVGSPTFNVAIAPFSLSIMGDDNDGLL
ncbi:hypothetical protein C4D60_Mb03t21580 [Musa balbisiana]|uniref:Protein ApaG n=1 Tax=Musa balbisiana TaxID=52838 RepID=A0A4S8JDB8_MUSBA|nr:hypothetical protein C4D60_Mb03t21580 [Musa balbisiana]